MICFKPIIQTKNEWKAQPFMPSFSVTSIHHNIMNDKLR